ncbi:MAG: CAP domain-containing protein [Rhodobacterales bacterium]|nr:CAP domain-containing protein [Rhodobacterales bacterium]
MSLTAAEQLLIELINRARLDPVAEATRLGIDLNEGLPAGTISSPAKQVLAPNDQLESAAISHSKWMLQTDVFSHTGVNGTSPGDRMASAGYVFEGSWTWGENIAWIGSSSTINPNQAIEDLYENLFFSPGHRENTLDPDFSEIGVGQEQGSFTSGGRTYNASMLTEAFASSGTSVFVTGVVISDKDGDRFYDIGEGLGGYWISGGGTKVQSESAGGYSLELTPSDLSKGTITVTLGKGSFTYGTISIEIGSSNAKVDLLAVASGTPSLNLSASTTLLSGFVSATLLGCADLDLTGNSSNNMLYGNVGKNDLTGNNGNDSLFGGDKADNLWGGNGNDKLWGDSGDDRLDGQAGSNTLTGGVGKDLFVFSTGKDRVMDFTDNVDTIQIKDRDSFGSSMTVSKLVNMFTIVDGDAVLKLSDGSQLIVENVTNKNMLSNDLEIV